MIGGSLNGGKILGDFPQPLSPKNDYWINKRARWIPTTPWEAVLNGVAQWLGVQDGDDLDWILPNRKSFATCDLFTDTDLFVDGLCDCNRCDQVTYAPTVVPTLSPSYAPSGMPSSTPSLYPSTVPSVVPSVSILYLTLGVWLVQH